MDYKNLKKLAEKENCIVLEDEPMFKHTSFKIGGKAKLLIKIKNKQSLSEIFNYILQEKIKYFILGTGCNLLVSDVGFNGVILKLSGEFKEINLLKNNIISCGAGAKLGELCLFALKNSLTGLEFAWGIPASIGGAVYMNAGAYGGEIKDIFFSSEHLTCENKEEVYFLKDMKFNYRHSVYMENDNLITRVKFKLNSGNKEEIKNKMDELLKRRKEKQPLGLPNAGSVFKRPSGNFAGTLIDSCGLRGKKIGGAQVSEKHCGFIVNTGNATCDDVLNLIKFIQDEVLKKKNILLEPEIRILK